MDPERARRLSAASLCLWMAMCEYPIGSEMFRLLNRKYIEVRDSYVDTSIFPMSEWERDILDKVHDLPPLPDEKANG